MDENPGPAPNPTDGSVPASPTPPVAPPAAESTNQPPVPDAPVTNQPAGSEPVTGEVVPKPKKKVGLIVSIIVVLLLLIGGGVAVAIILPNMNKTSSVAGAMEKLMSGDSPANVAVDGEISLDINNSSFPLKNVKFVLDSNLTSESMVNTSSMTVTVTNQSDDSASVTFDEVYTKGKDFYLKVDGVMKFIKDSNLVYYMLGYGNMLETNCIDGAAGTNCVKDESLIDIDTILKSSGLSDVIDLIDGEWLHISLDELESMAGAYVQSSALTCINDLTADLDKNKESVSQHYRDNAFVTSTDENITLPSKKYTVHKIVFDTDKLSSYIDTINNSAVLNKLYTCMGETGNVMIDKETVKEFVGRIPELFVEIDNDNNFSRFYFETEDEQGDFKIKADLSFNYSKSVDIAEPTEYKDFSEVIQKIMTNFMKLSNGVALKK